MGDNLHRNGQSDAAIAAYEQCFIALPEHLGLLKKIGDCYLALGQMEAAREAYLQLKSRLQPGSEEQPTSLLPH
jgi:tetratricopeptide (TPR) repeat protein